MYFLTKVFIKMVKENKFVYFGILFYFVYSQLYKVISHLLVAIILTMRMNIVFIHVFVLLFILLLSSWFYFKKEFFSIKIWFIALLVLVSVSISFFDIPNRLYLYNNLEYSEVERHLIMNYTLIYGFINTLLFLVIAYYKYKKTSKSDEV